MNIFAEKNKKLILGRQGENLVTAIRFPIKRWIEEFGEGTFLLVHKRSQDKEAYPCATHIEGDELIWEIYASDVEHVGDGLAQLSLLIGEKVAKSEVFHTSTLRSLDATENPPEAWKAWVDQVLEATTHYPVPVDGTWHIWVNGAYIDTGVRAEAKDGKTPVKGVDYFDGKDGHTPIKGVDYNDGHTPVMSGGKVGDVSTIYADGEPLISVEDGNSVDVKINGKSIVKDGVAEIPLADTSGNAGVLAVERWGFFGIKVNDNGNPYIAFADSNDIANRTSAYRPIVPANLDAAVKSALTDKKGGEYSETEKAAARERIGVAVDDVTVNGASIVTDGVASIPKSSSSAYGVLKLDGGFGIIDGKLMTGSDAYSGVPFINQAANSNIDSRGNVLGSYLPITPNRIDYAVKAALTDGRGAAYTDAEKAAALERIGGASVLSLSEKLDKDALTFTRINWRDIFLKIKVYDVIDGQYVEIPKGDATRQLSGFIEYSRDKTIINFSLKSLRLNSYEYGIPVVTGTKKIIDFGEIIDGFRPKSDIDCYSFSAAEGYTNNGNQSSVMQFGGDRSLIYKTNGHLTLEYYAWAIPTEAKPYLYNSFTIFQTLFNP